MVALGSFDGLHVGHQAVLQEARAMAEKLEVCPVICMFREHPLQVLEGKAPPALYEGSTKDRLLRETGMEVFQLDFSAVKEERPEEFFQKVLLDTLHAKGVCCGFNYSFGVGGSGTPALLEQLCREAGIAFRAVPAKKQNGLVISSTAIRQAIEEGRMEEANNLLGRPFCFAGPVTHGDGRGRTWGIPTINQPYPQDLVVPKKGVYLSRVTLDGVSYTGVTNIGVRPTVRTGETLSAETFVLDFHGNLYGKTPQISLYRFLRPEQKFPDFTALQEQIRKDIKAAEEAEKNGLFTSSPVYDTIL